MTHFKPMLAHKYDEKRVDWSKPVWMQPKLDGVRCVFTKDGAFSRTGKKFMNVQHLFTPKMFSLFKQNTNGFVMMYPPNCFCEHISN